MWKARFIGEKEQTEPINEKMLPLRSDTSFAIGYVPLKEFFKRRIVPLSSSGIGRFCENQAATGASIAYA